MLNTLILTGINFLIIDQCFNFKNSKNVSIDTLLGKPAMNLSFDSLVISLLLHLSLLSPIRP